MSADTINANLEPPVWVVHGVNWHANIPMDKMNGSLPVSFQIDEAATQALEAMRGDRTDHIIQLDENETNPFVGPVLLVYLQDTPPNQAETVPTHIILANNGYYKDSVIMEQKMNEMLEDIRKEQEKLEQIAKLGNVPSSEPKKRGRPVKPKPNPEPPKTPE
jgi:hypothetical protein